MKKSPLLLSLLKETFMISPWYVMNNLSWINMLLSGQLDFDGEKPPVFAFSPEAGLINVSGESMVDFSRVPKDSVLVLPVHGPMMKYGNICAHGMDDISETLARAAENKNIIGTVIESDTPGGGVDAIHPVHLGIGAMKSAGKPVGVVFETMASAGLYAFSKDVDFVWAANDISAMAGSLGVMMSFEDIAPMLEKEGRKRVTVYAPESTEKNKPFELALTGDYSAIKEEMLSPLAQKFIADMKKFRPNLKDDGKVFAGKMYYAKDALNIGLIDGFGTVSEAVEQIRKLASTGGAKPSASRIKAQNQNQNTSMKYAQLLAVLALTTLEFSKGFASLSKSQIDTLKAAYKKRAGRDLSLENLNFDSDNFAQLSEKDLDAIEQLFAAHPEQAAQQATPPAAQQANAATQQPSIEDLVKRVDTLEASSKKKDEIIAALGNSPDSVKLENLPKVIRMKSKESRELIVANGHIFGENEEWNKIDDSRPHNMALAAKIAGDYDSYRKIQAASTVDLTQITSDLGAFVDGRKGEIIEWFNPEDQLERVFPSRTDVKEGDFFISVELQSVLQQYQKAWTPKGDYKFIPRKPTLHDIKFDLEFEDLKSIERTWLNEFNKEGSAAYKMTFVEYLVYLAIRKGVAEWQIAAINGVYKAPTAGVAGSASNIVNGIRYQFTQFEAELLAKPFSTIGEWTSANILTFVKNMIAALPEDVRDKPGLGFYASSEFVQTYWEQRRVLEGTVKDYDSSKTTIPGHENIRLHTVPNMGNSKRVWIMPEGLILQLFGERENNNTGLVNVEKETRVIRIFGDFKRAIWPTVVGAKAANATALADRDYTYQMIWYNDADYASTDFLTLDPDTTTPSIKMHKNLLTPANSAATAITNITDAVTGDIVTIKCGSTTNASTIADSGNFDLASAWAPTAVGHYITVIKRSDGKWIEVERYAGVTPTVIAADDTTPDVTSGTEFITHGTNTQATAITKLDNAEEGETYTIYGGGGTNASTMADGTYLTLSAAWTGAAGAWIKLYCNGTKCIEVDREDAA